MLTTRWVLDQTGVYTANTAGDLNSIWRDSGIRLEVSKITMINYADPQRSMTALSIPNTVDATYTGVLTISANVSFYEASDVFAA